MTITDDINKDLERINTIREGLNKLPDAFTSIESSMKNLPESNTTMNAGKKLNEVMEDYHKKKDTIMQELSMHEDMLKNYLKFPAAQMTDSDKYMLNFINGQINEKMRNLNNFINENYKIQASIVVKPEVKPLPKIPTRPANYIDFSKLQTPDSEYKPFDIMGRTEPVKESMPEIKPEPKPEIKPPAEKFTSEAKAFCMQKANNQNENYDKNIQSLETALKHLKNFVQISNSQTSKLNTLRIKEAEKTIKKTGDIEKAVSILKGAEDLRNKNLREHKVKSIPSSVLPTTKASDDHADFKKLLGKMINERNTFRENNNPKQESKISLKK